MNVPAIEAVVEHVARTAKAYISAATTAVALVLQSQIHLNPTAHTWLAIALIILSYLATFVVPNKATGLTIGQAVAQDGPAFAQAVEALKNVGLPGPAAQVVDKVEAVEQKVAAELPAVEQAAGQVAPVVEAVAPAAAPVVEQVEQALTPPAAQ